jgi:hypothetical protein
MLELHFKSFAHRLSLSSEEVEIVFVDFTGWLDTKAHDVYKFRRSQTSLYQPSSPFSEHKITQSSIIFLRVLKTSRQPITVVLSLNKTSIEIHDRLALRRSRKPAAKVAWCLEIGQRSCPGNICKPFTSTNQSLTRVSNLVCRGLGQSTCLSVSSWYYFSYQDAFFCTPSMKFTLRTSLCGLGQKDMFSMSCLVCHKAVSLLTSPLVM